MNEFIEREVVEVPKRILVVAHNFLQAKHYIRTLPPEQRKEAKYVYEARFLCGIRNDTNVVHLIGDYRRADRWREIEETMHYRKLETLEVADW